MLVSRTSLFLCIFMSNLSFCKTDNTMNIINIIILYINYYDICLIAIWFSSSSVHHYAMHGLCRTFSGKQHFYKAMKEKFCNIKRKYMCVLIHVYRSSTCIYEIYCIFYYEMLTISYIFSPVFTLQWKQMCSVIYFTDYFY